MERIIVRPARKDDSQDLLKLIVALANFEHLSRPSRSAKSRLAKDIMEGKKARVLLAFLHDKPVGYALYFFTYSSFLARPTLYLEDIFVLEPYRRKGVGNALFSKCASEAIRNHCGRMEWAVLTWNKNAIRFYRKKGARKLGEWDYYRLDAAGLRKIHMGK